MKQNPLFKIGATLAVMAFSVATSQAALTTTYIGGGTGSATGDTTNAVGPVTLLNNTDSGDMWDTGDEYIYVHEANRVTGSFTATARIIGQTEAANGSWGKTGIRASDNLTTSSSFAMVQSAAGNATQPSGANPVPHRLAGRTGPAVNNMYEDGIGAANSNDTFRTDGGVNATWVSLSYDAPTNGFTAGFAPDVAGVPGTWTFSAVRTNVLDSNAADGWYLGLAYSAHADMSLGNPAVEGIHGVTFDNFSIIPEPSTALLGVAGLALVLRRRRRS